MVDTEAYLDLFTAVTFLALLVIFIFQTTKKKRSAPSFILSLLFGSFGGIITYFQSIGFGTGNSINMFLTALQLTCYSLQFVFFFLFLETLQFLKLNAIRWSVVLILFVIQQFSLWRLAYFPNITGSENDTLWFWADFGYDVLAIYVFFIIGVPIYAKMVKYTKENRSLIMLIALIIVSLGFFVGFANDFTSDLNISVNWLDNISVLGEFLPLIGLILFLLCYITDVDYIYRLPNDNHILMVSYKSGLTIHTVRFKTHLKNVNIEENLLSGLITSLNMVFKSVLESKEEIENVISKDATILMQSGVYITATFVADKVSAILDKSLKRYVLEFEEKFKKQLETEDILVSDFDSAIELLKPIFPYLIIKK